MLFSDISKYNKKTEELILIIGSGPAGISLALELEKQKINSLILEAGDLDYSEKSQDFYEAEVIGDHLVDDIKYTRLRMFGGTSGHWGGTCRPLDNYDFKKWPIASSVGESSCDISGGLLIVSTPYPRARFSISKSSEDT